MTQSQQHMDIQYWGQRYLRNALSQDEKHQFELYLLDNPAAAATLEIDAIFLDIMPEAVKKPAVFTRLLHWLKKGWATPMRASIATSALCFTLMALLIPAIMHSNKSATIPSAMISSQLEYLEPVRSAAMEEPRITFRADSTNLALMVQTFFAEPTAQYRVRVIAKATQQSVSEQLITGNRQGEILLVLSRNAMQSGSYVVEISPNGQNTTHNNKQSIGFYLAME